MVGVTAHAPPGRMSRGAGGDPDAAAIKDLLRALIARQGSKRRGR